MTKTLSITLIIMCLVTSSVWSEVDKLHAIEEMTDKNGISSVMSQIVEYEQSQLPIKKDRIDTITSVMYVKSTRSKIYKHMLIPGWEEVISDISDMSAQEAKKYMPDLMEKQSINSICSNKLNRIYLKHGVKIVNIYSKSDGTKLFETTVSDSDCGA